MPGYSQRMIQITVNGEARSLADGLCLDALVEQLGLPPDRVAIEHNRRVIRRFQWPAVRLSEGDQIEVVQLVGGG